VAAPEFIRGRSAFKRSDKANRSRCALALGTSFTRLHSSSIKSSETRLEARRHFSARSDLAASPQKYFPPYPCNKQITRSWESPSSASPPCRHSSSPRRPNHPRWPRQSYSQWPRQDAVASSSRH